jgi:hypothetical protein
MGIEAILRDMHMTRILPGILLVLVVITFAASSADASSLQQAHHAIVRYPVNTVTTSPLRHIPELPDVVHDLRKLERKMLPNRIDSADMPQAGVVQNGLGSASVATTGASFDGLGNRNGVLPPDTVGVIGPNHFVQMTNMSFAVYDRTGNVLFGPVNNNTLWSQLGGVCASNNDGDPVVLYDHAADRWLVSQFALPNYPRGPFYQCIAVSATGDPTGEWHQYSYLINDTKLNDYPKFGVWRDGYYMSINQFKCKVIGCTWAGAAVVAFERDKMLGGDPSARSVYFDLYSTDPNLGGFMPADWDGQTPPPAGAPVPFVQMDDDSWGYSPDQLQIWNFHADWANPDNSTFSLDSKLTVAPFDSNLCNYARNCIPQPGGTNVDALSDRLMYRLQYRNFGTDQSPDQVLLTNHTVDVGSNHAGVRWYALHNAGSGWSINQQSTYAPDSEHRWMGSIAMNGAGDIGLGYSVASNLTYPSIRFTGRLHGDSPGIMTQGEGTIVNGGGSQSHSTGRWGDYSMMSVDPVDDCTFWYTQEYYSANSSAGWKTRIGSFKLAECDDDNDGLTNMEEAMIGTDPLNPDTDGDGLSDGQEVNQYATDPLNADSDGDFLGDGDEVNVYGSDPNHDDSGYLAPRGNPDGVLNTGDLVVQMRLVLGMDTPDARETALADINHDQLLNAADILLLLSALGM